ncbi:glycoside hydrolase [Staphylotrichum tortipilum]|uniref:alpha-1,2-Mannosidase n=1 Tax=Staphylotrichum tortipilum TaxID=2831512 RepID=A0AAN6RQ90_9PEZI|nr:glycoside hydrolase [Staphylotrichum longicolle]
MARWTRGWPFCFLPSTVRRNLALDRRPSRVLLAAAPEAPSHVGSHPDIRFRASSFDWRPVTQQYPQFSPVQRVFSSYIHDTATQSRQRAVRAAFIRSWGSYKKYAWLWDDLAPVSANKLVDSLDTLWIMNLPDEFYQAAAAAAQLDWANTTETAANLFETTIRHLGGLLSAFDLSHEPALLEKARELGNMLYMAFDTPNRMPGFWINFEDAKNGQQVVGTGDPSASPYSLSLEFTRLSQLTGDPKFYDAISRISDFLERTQGQSKLPGMWPKLINFNQELVTDGGFTMGALADSLYEYLPKMSALLGGRLPGYEKMYRAAMETAKEHLLFRPMVSDDDKAGKQVLFVGDAIVHSKTHIEHIAEGQHLSCFTGGMFGLGGKLFNIPDHLAIGERLARGCAWAYDAFPTGLMPEIFGMMPCESIDGPCPFDEEVWEKYDDSGEKSKEADGGKIPSKGFKNARDPRYILRPEAIESLFLLYRMTGKDELRELAWRMFESVMKATETPVGNSAIADVTVLGETTKTDSMESFFLSETLKYFYLIFSPPDLISLNEFVFNTEAHPFRRPK